MEEEEEDEESGVDVVRLAVIRDIQRDFGARRVASIAGSDHYYVTDDGRVFSARGRLRQLLGRKKRPGRYVVIGGRSLRVSELVAVAFVPKPSAAHDLVVHVDGDPRNNDADNLRWAVDDRPPEYRFPTRAPPRQNGELFTDRQWAVFDLIVLEAASTPEIAKRLRITERTVKYHVKDILDTLGMENRLQLAVMFWRAYQEEQALAAAEDPPRDGGAALLEVPPVFTPTIRRPSGWTNAIDDLADPEAALEAAGWRVNRTKYRWVLRGQAEDVVRVSAFRSPDGRVSFRELVDSARACVPAGAPLTPFEAGTFDGVRYEAKDIDDAMRLVWLRRADVMVVVHHLCPASLAYGQAEAFDAVVRALQLVER